MADVTPAMTGAIIIAVGGWDISLLLGILVAIFCRLFGGTAPSYAWCIGCNGRRRHTHL